MDTNVVPARRGSRWKHLLWIVPAAVAALLAAGWFGLPCAVENAARRCLADTSFRLLGREVEPEEIRFSLAGQELLIRGIRVDNPPGYSEDRPALRVDLIQVRVEPLNLLFRRVAHLKKLTVSGIDINVELKTPSSTFESWKQQFSNPEINLIELRKTASGPGRGPVRNGNFGSGWAGEPWLFRIDELRVEKGKAFLCNFTSISEKWRTLPLDSYVQRNLGRERPLTAEELAVEIFNRHLEEIRRSFADTRQNMKKYLSDTADGIMSKADEMRARMQAWFREKMKKKAR